MTVWYVIKLQLLILQAIIYIKVEQKIQTGYIFIAIASSVAECCVTSQR